ncbi:MULTISPECIES: retention module-containing protein, partial [unclassified Achromobacter]|uniref:retention module-containing protein n=1 Tax=unclassified Achromobacter TaxID=2626865 RepID=UPI000B51988E
MAYTLPATILQITGQAWMRNADGSLTALHVGSHIPPDTEIVTGPGATVSLQVEGGMPILIGENRDVSLTQDLTAGADKSEASVANPQGTDSDRLLAALQSGQDPFDTLDPTAALVSAGSGDAGGSSFVRLARILEQTTPLDLAYPRPAGAEETILQPTGGGADTTNDTAANGPATTGTNSVSLVSGNGEGTVKEDTTLSSTGKLLVLSTDPTQEVFAPQTNTAGAHGTFSIGADGTWSYQLNNADPAVQALAVGESMTESFTVRSADGATGTVTVTIQGTNDAPVIDAPSGSDTGSVTEDAAQAASGQFSKTDIDTTDTHTWSVVGSAKGTYGTFSVDQTGKWTYTLDNAAAQPLTAKDHITETYTVQVDDGHGGTATKTVTVTINGVDDGAIITPHAVGADAGTVKEDTTLQTSGKLDVVDPDAGQAAFVAQTSKSQFGTFTLGTDGTWSFTLDNAASAVQALGVNDTRTETFTVATIDGTTSTVRVQILGTNDAPTITAPAGSDVGSLTEDTAQTASGQFSKVDVDASDTHTWTVDGNAKGAYGTFSVDQTGKWTYTLDNAAAQSLTANDHIQETYTVKVDDGHGGTDTKSVTVTINGTDDAAIITPHAVGADAGTVKEDTTLQTSGKLDIVDPDAGQAVFVAQTNAAGQHGTFSITSDGTWTYNLNNADPAVQALGVNESMTEKFTVTSADGTPATITVTIQGTNDAPVIGAPAGSTVGSVTEDATQTATGQFSQQDLDTNDMHTWTVDGNAKGAYGTFTVDQTGKWTYTLDNAAAQQLTAKDHIQETYTVKVDDGHGGTDTKSVTVTINGADDGAIITPHATGSDAGTVKEDTTLQTSGKLDIVDPDAGQAVFVAQTNAAGQHGTFSITSDGTWTYNLNNADPAVQALGVNESMTEKFTVTSADGTPATITVTIQGTNDAPVITAPAGATAGSVTEDAAQTATGQFSQQDTDTNDSHTWTVDGNAKGAYGTFTVDQTGKWTYTLDNAAAQSLTAKDHIQETYTVKVDDGHGGTDTKSVTVTINGTDDAAIITPHAVGADAGTVKEDTTLSTSGKLDIVDPDAGQAVFVAQTNAAGQHGTFSITSDGTWT